MLDNSENRILLRELTIASRTPYFVSNPHTAHFFRWLQDCVQRSGLTLQISKTDEHACMKAQTISPQHSPRPC